MLNQGKIRYWITSKKHKYPELNTNEEHAIRVIASSLYENIKTESEKSLDLYKQLDEAFVQ